MTTTGTTTNETFGAQMKIDVTENEAGLTSVWKVQESPTSIMFHLEFNELDTELLYMSSHDVCFTNTAGNTRVVFDTPKGWFLDIAKAGRYTRLVVLYKISDDSELVWVIPD